MSHLGAAFLPVLHLLAAPAVGAAANPAARGLEIARAADQANQGFGGETATLTLELVNAHGDVTRRKMTMEILEVADDGDRSRSTFEWPPDVKGTRLLTWSHKKTDDDQWLYLPAVKRTKRIAASNKSGSFMGSEFTYEDLGSSEVEKFTYRYLDEPKVNGRDTWRIERVPVEKQSGYKREVVWMDKEYLSPLRVEYFDRKDELLKVALFEGHKRYGKLWRFQIIRMDNMQTRKKSVLTWDSRQVGVKLPPERFDNARIED